MAGSLSNYLENKILDHMLGATVYTAPGNVYAGLITDSNTSTHRDAGTVTEVTGGSYARVTIPNNDTNWPAASGGNKSNGGVITFPTASAAWGVITGVGLWDAATNGNLLAWSTLGADQGILFSALADDTVHAPGHALIVNDPIVLQSIPGASLPTGIADNTIYYVKTVSGAYLTLSASVGGAVVDITSAGTGLIAKIVTKTVGMYDSASVAIGGLTIALD